jgi:PAS domain S-box-containing protein
MTPENDIPSGNALLGILLEIIEELLGGAEYESAIVNAFRRLALLMHIERVYLFSIHEENKEAVASLRYKYRAQWCHHPSTNEKLYHVPIEQSGYGRWLAAFKAGEVIEGHRNDFPPQEQYLLQEEGIESLICIPVFVKERLWGFFGLDFNREQHRWRKRDKLILRLFADVLAGLIITHRQEKMLTKQKASLLQFYELLENIPIEVHLLNPETMHYSYMNRTALEHLGYGEEEYEALTPADIVNDLAPDEIFQTIVPLLDDVQEKALAEAWQRRKDGSAYPVETRLARMMFNDSEHLVALAIDMTEYVDLKKALDEEKQMFKDLFRLSIDSAMLLKEGRVVEVNEATLALYGMSKEEILQKTFSELSPTMQPDGISSEMKAQKMLTACEESGSCRFEWVHSDKGGRTFWADVALTRLQKKGETLIYAVLRDITQRKENEMMIVNQQNQLANTNNILNQRYEEELRLRQELEYYKNQLEEQVAFEVAKNREKDRLLHNQSKNIQMGEMLSMIAHQWRQPLNAISASAIAVSMKHELDSLTPQALMEHLEFVKTHTQKMSVTINDFMDFFKPEHDKQLFEIADLINEIESLIGAQLKSRGVTLCFDCDPAVRIYGYRKELSHVLINLIANARDAYETTDSEEKRIDISIVSDREQWVIGVEDYAGGIPTEHLEKVFNPYFTTKEQSKGTGIGLYMSQRIIQEVYQGNMGVANTARGARFTVNIPREEASSD